MPELFGDVLHQPELMDRVKQNLLSADYRFAKTMPENPHWYTLRKTWDQDAAFCEAVQFIRDHGYIERYKGRPYTMFNLNGYKYWTMGAPINNKNGEPCTILINRAKTQEPSDYDAIAERYDELFADRDALEENAEIMSLIAARPDGRVLDIGCGTGLLLRYVSPAGYVGIDPSAQMLGQLVTNYPEYRGNIIHGRFEEFYDTGGGFDLIVSLFGAPNYIAPAYFSHICGLLKPGGRVFAMFYQEGYVPVSYLKTGVSFPHHETSEYNLANFTQRRHRDTFLIAEYERPA